ncbi:hypothetical protein [Streptomyces caatingaensis]|uniref:Uncharacterized protein n=1 Tax=Streptomyces caatingaensis TaxID=1678637 RepID=A0A0K9XNQ9_9ACTN|nr:hypothetical protein [Streptomyces caatingaensis]KNB54342.1 hypothetical protein AC230_00170 [Streptomyces caatingaensis]
MTTVHEPVPVHISATALTDDPEPAPGCDVCGALARQRVEARRTGDFSQATDCNVELRQHPHTRRR